MGRHWTEQLSCHACGATFRSAIAEAKHRHNFPVLCKRGKRFTQFLKEVEDAKAGASDEVR